MEKYKKIKINQSDSIYDICKKIEEIDSKEDSFYLETDYNEALKNYLNLKILISRFINKKFVIVTSNKEIKKIWEKLGIKYFYKSDEIEFDEKFSKTNVLRHNFTFFEYLKYEIKRELLKYFFLFSKKAKKTYKNRNKSQSSHVFLLVIGLIASLSLLSFIFYFAVSKTYIYIKPELSVKTVSRNVAYSEKNESWVFDSKNVIKVNPIWQETLLDYVFNVSSIDINSAQNAYWKVEIYNELSTEQIFKPNTRFVTENWIIFRSNEWIKVPKTTKNEEWKVEIWKTEATLIADLYDNSGKIIWSRWNIKSSTILTIPGLKFNRDKIYAKTMWDFGWWAEPKVHVLTEDEYKKFTWIIQEKLKTKALNELKDKIKDMNQKSATNFEIIPINNILQYSESVINMWSWIKIGDKMEEIKLSWKISLNTYVYDKASTIFYLRNILNENILLWTEKLIWINDNSLRITNILSQTVNPFYMKATTELDSTISYNFEDPTNNLTRKLKNLILNTSKKEATSILLNDPNIANVKIEFSPFWLSSVSNNPDNVEFIIEK